MLDIPGFIPGTFTPISVMVIKLKKCVIFNNPRFSFDQSGVTGTPLGAFILGTDKLGGLGDVKVEKKSLTGTGRGIDLTFTRTPTSGNLNQGMEILGYIIEFEDSEDTGLSSVQ